MPKRKNKKVKIPVMGKGKKASVLVNSSKLIKNIISQIGRAYTDRKQLNELRAIQQTGHAGSIREGQYQMNRAELSKKYWRK